MNSKTANKDYVAGFRDGLIMALDVVKDETYRERISQKAGSLVWLIHRLKQRQGYTKPRGIFVTGLTKVYQQYKQENRL